MHNLINFGTFINKNNLNLRILQILDDREMSKQNLDWQNTFYFAILK